MDELVLDTPLDLTPIWEEHRDTPIWNETSRELAGDMEHVLDELTAPTTEDAEPGGDPRPKPAEDDDAEDADGGEQ